MNAPAYTIRGRELIVPSGMSVRFDSPIAEAVQVADTIVVVLEPQKGVISNENVFGIDGEGRIKWQIARQPWGEGNLNNPYVGVQARGGEIQAFNWSDRVVFVDPRDGRVLRWEQNK
ncbi:MAG TPA: hypothetical protein VGR35_11630 [Tepidisphaeraceae bacterium]|nr:hypothetical protein [Tepidisphaeraceae bacterium]